MTTGRHAMALARPPALHGFEIFLAVAPFCSLLLTFVGIASLYIRS